MKKAHIVKISSQPFSFFLLRAFCLEGVVLKVCQQCNKSITKPLNYSYKQWNKKKFCSTACAGLSRQGESHSSYKTRKDAARWLEIECACGQKFKDRESTKNTIRGKYCSKNCVYKYAVLKGKQHHNWKDGVGYTALHSWVRRELGKPMQCEFCGYKSSNTKEIHWANKSQEYKRDLNDWLRLCVKCHHKYDNIQSKMWATRKELQNA